MTPLEALQAALAGEHAAVYLYGVLGGRVSQSHQPRLFAAVQDGYDLHVRQRDRLTVLVTRAHGVPTPGEPSYRLPNQVADPAQMRATARLVERRCVLLYGQLVGSSSGSVRAWALAALGAGALRELEFGAAPSDFPGLGSAGPPTPGSTASSSPR